DANDGSVTIRTWDRKEIEAHVTTTGWKIEPGEVTVSDHQNGDRVDLEIRIPHHNFSFNFGINHRSVRLMLQVPKELRSDIHTGDGSITIDGVHGETRLSTGDGHIEAERLDGSLDAQTGDGRIRIRGRFDTLNVHTGDGSIEAEIENGSRISTE